MARLRNIILLICILLLFGCAKSQVKIYPEKPYPEEPYSEKPHPEKPLPTEPPATTSPVPSPVKPSPAKPSAAKALQGTYSEMVSDCKSYEDLVRWMEKEFSFDAGRFDKFKGMLPPPRTPEETFQLKAGIDVDAALFIRDTLNRINPLYNAKVAILIIRPYGTNHYFCSFQNNRKIFIMDYGTPFDKSTGIHGPFNSLQGVKAFYDKYYPVKGRIEGISYLP